MKNTLTLFAILITLGLSAQQGQWIWMKGTNQPYGAPTWGTQGVAAAANTPPGLTMSASWTDLQGRFWLMGGYDPTGTFPSIGYRDALWMFDPATNMWTWMKGTNLRDQPGVYGTMGVPNINNYPGARRLSYAWTDLNGDLWLFGGEGIDGSGTMPSTNGAGLLNDLWRYTIATNTWTWMGGSHLRNQIGSFGTIGVTSAGNVPPARCYGNSWRDTQGNFWLFGGCAMTANRMNDTWKYDPVTNMWTWMKGGPASPRNGISGIQGISAPANVPAARYSSASWIDNINGDLWIFGGQIDSSYAPNTSQVEMEDLWKYHIATNEWTWVAGSILTEDSAVFQPPCSASSASAYPGGVSYLGNSSWEDGCGNFWFYGGAASASSGTTNNLWCYKPSLNKWYFVSGDQYAPISYFGAQGVANPLNDPDDRTDGSSWVDNNGNFWTFGGSAGYVFNDLWKFIPDYCCNADFSTCCAKTISVEEMSAEGDQHAAFPNPASDQMNVSIDANADRVLLFDMSGRIVLQDNDPMTTDGLYILSLNGIASGTYILRIESADACSDQQVVVSRR